VAGRPTSPADLAALRRAYERQVAVYQSDMDAARALVSVGAAPRDESLNPVEHAALSAVCLAILNLDESLCRE